jgi:hypothetical protein
MAYCSTLLPYLVRKLASSMALSPPPMTASGRLRKIGAAPSHTAHAETPCTAPEHPAGIFIFTSAIPDVSRAASIHGCIGRRGMFIMCMCMVQAQTAHLVPVAGSALAAAGEHHAASHGACGDDHRLRLDLLTVRADDKGPLGQAHAVDGLREDLGAEALGLLTELFRQLAAHDAVGEARVVLHIRGRRQLTACRDAVGEPPTMPRRTGNNERTGKPSA